MLEHTHETLHDAYRAEDHLQRTYYRAVRLWILQYYTDMGFGSRMLVQIERELVVCNVGHFVSTAPCSHFIHVAPWSRRIIEGAPTHICTGNARFRQQVSDNGLDRLPMKTAHRQNLQSPSQYGFGSTQVKSITPSSSSSHPEPLPEFAPSEHKKDCRDDVQSGLV